MWRTTITLSIIAVFTGATFAQPAAEPKPADPADKPKVDDEASRKLEEQLRAEKADIAEKQRQDMDLQRRATDQARRAVDQQRRAIDQQVRAAEQQARAAADRATQAYKRGMLPAMAGRAAVPTRKEKVAYLGVATMEVSPELASQLKLSPGMGLVVNMVLPDSPAERAGVKQYDVITRLDN